MAVVLVAAALMMPAGASATPTAQISDGTIEGTIVDVDGNPLRYIQVFVYEWNGSSWDLVYNPDPDWWEPGYAFTDDTGFFSFDITPGSYRLKFVDWGDYEWRDWMAASEFYDDVDDIGLADNVPVTPGGTIACDAEMAPQEYGAASGFITDASTGIGTYDVGVDFYAYNGVDGYDWIQGSGSRALGDWWTSQEWTAPLEEGCIPADEYKIEFYDYYGRYVPQWWGGGDDMSLSPTVTIAPYHMTSGLNAAMDRACEIHGTVYEPSTPTPTVDGSPQQGIWPQLYEWNGSDWGEVNDTGLQKPTDANGEYEITGLRPGAYRLMFVPGQDAPGYGRWVFPEMSNDATFAAGTPIGDACDLGEDILLGSQEVTTGIDCDLDWSGVLAGRVTYPGGGPAEWYHVTVWNDAGTTQVTEVWTDENGYYWFGGLPYPANYHLRFDDEADVYTSHPMGWYYWTEWYDNVFTTASALPLGVGKGTGQGGLETVLQQTTVWGDVAGAVTDAFTGRSLEGMAVSLLQSDGGGGWVWTDTDWTDSAGKYSFTRVDAGTVKVVAQDEGMTDVGPVYEDKWYNDLDEGMSGGLAVSGAATATANLAMDLRALTWDDRDIGGITGRVRRASDNAAVPGAPVSFFEHDADSGEWWYAGGVRSNSLGYFITGVAAGDYRVQFGPTVSLASEYNYNTTDFDAATTVTVPVQDYVLVPDAYLANAFTISGKVRDGSGAGLERVGVEALEYDSDWDVWAPVGMYSDASWGYTDANGDYTIGGLNAGTYRVRFAKWEEGDDYPPDWTVKHYQAGTGGAQSVDQATNLTVGPSKAGIDATLTSAGYLRGAVSDQDGKRVGMVKVKLWWREAGGTWNQINSTYTYSGTDFEFTGFGAGDYFLEFDDDLNGLYEHSWHKGVPTSGTATPITYAGGESRVVTVTLQTVATNYTPIFGASRYDTAVNAAYEAYPMGASTVVISTGKNWPDALGGAALAGAYGGPILLTDPAVLPGQVETCIEDLGATDAIILGGTGAVSAAVESQLEGLLGSSHVRRIAGASRYATANRVATETVGRLGGAYDGYAFFATGGNFPDALGASPLAAAASWPIFLVGPDGLDPATQQAVIDANVTHAIVLGGTGAVSSAAESVIATLVGGSGNVERIAGNSRYDTCAKAAQYGVDHVYGLGWNNVAIATGQKYPDALAGGVLQGKTGSVMLLTPGLTLDTYTRAKLIANKNAIAQVRYLGGGNAVSEDVRDDIASVLNSGP